MKILYLKGISILPKGQINSRWHNYEFLSTTYSFTSWNFSLFQFFRQLSNSIEIFSSIFFVFSIPISDTSHLFWSISFQIVFPVWEVSHSISRISSRTWNPRPRSIPNCRNCSIFLSVVTQINPQITRQEAINPPVFSSWSRMISSIW